MFSERHSAQKPPSSSCVTSKTSSFMLPKISAKRLVVTSLIPFPLAQTASPTGNEDNSFPLNGAGAERRVSAACLGPSLS
jgi:hypothetical protein